MTLFTPGAIAGCGWMASNSRAFCDVPIRRTSPKHDYLGFSFAFWGRHPRPHPQKRPSPQSPDPPRHTQSD